MTSARACALAVSGPALDRAVPIVLYADEWGGVGGTVGYVLMLGREMVRRGHCVTAICHDAPGVSGMRHALVGAGVDVRAVDLSGGLSPAHVFARHRQLAAIVREHSGCAVLMLMGYFSRGGGMLAAARAGRARVVVRADLTPPEPPYRLKDAIAIQLKDLLVDRVVVGAGDNVDLFCDRLRRRHNLFTVIHTGVELDRFAPGRGREQARREFGFDGDDCVVGTVARLDDHRKGVADFVAMAAKVAAYDPRAKFLVVGDGVLRAGLEEQALRVGAAGAITFCGWRSDLPALLAAMDVFCMTSTFEGGPTSVLEAMATGLAVVATRVGMVPEVIDDGADGVVVDPGRADALAAAVRLLVRNSGLRARLGSSARARALAELSIEEMTNAYLQLLAGVRRSRPWHRTH